ncbi:hypothetical protein [Rubritalea tangerina]
MNYLDSLEEPQSLKSVKSALKKLLSESGVQLVEGGRRDSMNCHIDLSEIQSGLRLYLAMSRVGGEDAALMVVAAELYDVRGEQKYIHYNFMVDEVVGTSICHLF